MAKDASVIDRLEILDLNSPQASTLKEKVLQDPHVTPSFFFFPLRHLPYAKAPPLNQEGNK